MKKYAPPREDANVRNVRAVVESTFLAAGGASSAIVSLAVADSQTQGSATVVGIIVIGCLFAISLLVAALYVWRRS